MMQRLVGEGTADKLLQVRGLGGLLLTLTLTLYVGPVIQERGQGCTV